jgi:hypothetical protein
MPSTASTAPALLALCLACQVGIAALCDGCWQQRGWGRCRASTLLGAGGAAIGVGARHPDARAAGADAGARAADACWRGPWPSAPPALQAAVIAGPALGGLRLRGRRHRRLCQRCAPSSRSPRCWWPAGSATTTCRRRPGRRGCQPLLAGAALRLCPPQGGARRHLARPLRRAAGRRHRAAADLRQGRAAGRPRGAWACCARRRPSAR